MMYYYPKSIHANEIYLKIIYPNVTNTRMNQDLQIFYFSEHLFWICSISFSFLNTKNKTILRELWILLAYIDVKL